MPKYVIEYDTTVYRKVEVDEGQERPVLRVEEGKTIEVEAPTQKEAREKFEIMKSGHPYRDRVIKKIAKVG